MSTYEQFVQFGVDSFGLERTLRLLQSLAHITLSNPLLLLSSPILTPDLLTLRSTLNLSRRIIRTFRFLACFSAAQSLYSPSTTSSSPLSLESWLDVMKLSLLGLFGLLETITIPDLAGMEVFGVDTAGWLNDEAQRLWFFGLACGVLGGLVRIVGMGAERAVPATGAGYAAVGDEDTKGEKVLKTGEKEELRAESGKPASVTGSRDKNGKGGKEVVQEERRVRASEKRALVRKVAADAVDMVLPVSVLEWVEIQPVVVGLAMFASTVVSGYDVWKGVGVQVKASKTKA